MNYPWDVLRIDETDDKKLIKKAYAKLIRIHRPDEAPEKFQLINSAYKYALAEIKRQSYEAVSSPQNELGSAHENKAGVDLYNTEPEVVSQANFPEIELGSTDAQQINFTVEDLKLEEPIVADELGSNDAVNLTSDDAVDIDLESVEEKISEMFEVAHEVAFSSIQKRSNLDSWSFLEYFYEIHDIQLRDDVAKEMFRRVAEYNLFQLKQNKVKLIPVNVIMYMNEIFQWDTNWQEYNAIFPEHYVRVNFEDVEKTDNFSAAKSYPKVSTRFVAVLVDMFIYFMFGGFVAAFIDIEKLNEGVVVFVGFAVFRLITELVSPQRNTLAVMYLGYRYLDEYLNLPSRVLTLKRFACFELMMVPVYLTFSELFAGETMMLFLSGYGVAILVFVYLKKGQFPHDYLSKTVVVRKV